jgi:hypothetical protein
MATKKSSGNKQNKTASGKTAPQAKRAVPKSLAFAEAGIHTAQQFAGLMSALMTDLLNGSVTPGIGNATCNAGGKLLKMVELNQKYGQAQVENGLKNMQLVTPDSTPLVK